jgi:hypothetical protein
MACEHPNEEWTVSTKTDTTLTRGLLVFCLNIKPNGKINGLVSELPVDDDGIVIGDPIPLGKVKGHQDPTTEDPSVFVMTLDFRWGRNRVIVAGIRFTSTTPNTFAGRFSAFSSAGLAAAAGAETRGTTILSSGALPADGDTGTATGTQT